MQIPTQKLKEILLQEGIINEDDFDRIVNEAKRKNHEVIDELISRSIITQFFLPRPIDEKILKLLPEEMAHQKRAIAFYKEADGAMAIAMMDPSDLGTIKFLEEYLGSKIKVFLAREDDLNKGFALYGLQLSEDFKKIIENNITESLRLGRKGEDAATEMPIVAIVDNLVAYAYASRASDVHFEILEDTLLIRYRIDGVLREVIKISKEVHSAIVARVKLLSGLKIDEHYKPQDGRFRATIGSESLDIRVSIIPTYHGEKVEMRLLSAAQRPLSLQELGVLDDMAAIIQDNIKRSYGMVLVCGPTGSGKTTTLYSLLNILNRPEVNIVTVEDPIEYDIKYVNQTQINPQAGVTFANGLRSILRQDPNIILVGEIRDEETAGISVQAALTGHLVLSSLHTNDAATAIPRLMDMKVVPFLAAAVLNAIMAQRLVRKICSSCVYSLPLSKELQSVIGDQLKQLGVYNPDKLSKLVYAGKGCAVCGGSGYRGRLGIYEILNITEEVRKLIVSADFSLDSLRVLARKQGTITMFEDGLRKAELGLTTIEEVLRVIRE
ncbi:MAG: Type II secretion system protein E [Parcubacteria group bacterium Athens0714_26]|nr:MAG: Type II secretion system protein E [Parcubacteria group bacterium Athens0714_26]